MQSINQSSIIRPIVTLFVFLRVELPFHKKVFKHRDLIFECQCASFTCAWYYNYKIMEHM